MELQGSCRCGNVKFRVLSHTPCPFMRCYCSICRKTAGCGGYAINIMGQYETMRVEGEEHVKAFSVLMPDGKGGQKPSTNARYFCGECGSHLWARDPQWSQWVYPLSGAIDAPDLPKPPHTVHIMLGSKASWVDPQVGPNDAQYDEYPELGIEEWHKKHGMYVQAKEA